MKPLRNSLVFLGAVLSATLAAQSVPAISSPPSRKATVKAVDDLLAPRAVEPVNAELKDPFNPSAQDLQEDFDPNAAAKKPTPIRSDAELLQVLAKQIQPTGSMMLGGEPYLLFIEKRQKIGDKVSVPYEGVEYVLEITSIESNRFRLRYNNEEMVRTIK